LGLREKINDILSGTMTDKGDILAVLRELIDSLDAGETRVVAKTDGRYEVLTWVKQGILLIFKYFDMKEYSMSGISFNDKFGYKGTNGQFRFVPGGSSIREGCYIAKGVILMPPTFVNVGAYIDESTMIDSVTLVGSCAQIGKKCHISAGTIIGGVLEPLNANPVIIEDNVFVGGNCGLYEGVLIERNSVIGTGTIINASTPVTDVETGEIYYGKVPEGSVVIPGGKKKIIRGKEYMFQAPLIIKKRENITDQDKVKTNDLLREFLSD